MPEPQTQEGRPYRSGFVGIVGRPNVGKSTILNYYLGEKIAIVSPCPQTTRTRILGVLTRADVQVVFIDSPGLHESQHALGRHMREVAKAVMEESDVLVVVIDGRVGLTASDARVFDHVRHVLQRGRVGTPARSRTSPEPPWRALLAINKTDALKKPKLLPLIEACAKTELFSECIPISARTGDQMEVLFGRIVAQLPEGPHWYEPGQRTDQTPSQLIGELVREQVLLATRQEVPHAVAVLVEQIQEHERIIVISATLVVERPGQKAILIGRSGSMLKQIGRSARVQIERLLGRKVYLELWVKVVEDWRRDTRVLRQLGYTRTA